MSVFGEAIDEQVQELADAAAKTVAEQPEPQETPEPEDAPEPDPTPEPEEQAEETSEPTAEPQEEPAPDDVPSEYLVDYKYKGEVHTFDFRDRDRARELIEMGMGAKSIKKRAEEATQQGQAQAIEQMVQDGLFERDAFGNFRPGPRLVQWVQAQNPASNGGAATATPTGQVAGTPGQAASQPSPAAAQMSGQDEAQLEALKEAAIQQNSPEAWLAYDHAKDAVNEKRIQGALEARLTAWQEQQQQTLAQQQAVQTGSRHVMDAQAKLRPFYKNWQGKDDTAQWQNATDRALAHIQQGGDVQQALAFLQQQARNYQEATSSIVQALKAQAKPAKAKGSAPRTTGPAKSGAPKKQAKIDPRDPFGSVFKDMVESGEIQRLADEGPGR